MHRRYAVHSSHPCEAVERALALEGIPYGTVELLIATQVVLQRLRFGQGTVPGLKLDGGEKVSSSRAILRKLDELVPDPPLLPADAAARAAVLEAERWGERVLQLVAPGVIAIERRINRASGKVPAGTYPPGWLSPS